MAEAWQYQKIVSSGITVSDPRSNIKRKLTQTAAIPMVGLLAKIVRKVDKGEEFEKAIVAAGKLEKAIESLPAGLKVQRVRAGVDSERVAIVGRSMGDADRGLIGVNDAAAHFEAQGIKVETFKPTKDANEEFSSAIRAYKRETGSAMLPPDKVAQTKTWIKVPIDWSILGRE